MPIRQFIQSVLGLFFLVSSSLALSNTEFTYNVIDGGIELTGCVGECPTDLVIPEEIDGYNVISIGDSAFQYNELNNVTIGNSVSNIGHSAFRGNQLTSLTIPDSVNTIGEGAFLSNQLTGVNIGNSVISIGQSSFGYNLLTNLTIPHSVTSIGYASFALNQLTSVHFLGSRPEIGSVAFSDSSISTITYCTETTGWPGESIGGITPQFDESCGIPNDANETISYAALDIDQNGSFDALKDGLILLRYAFGLRGESLIDSVIDSNANRTNAEDIEAHIQSLAP